MSKTKYSLILLLLLCIAFSLNAEEKEKLHPMNSKHAKWLDEVHWIISDYERKGFESLKHDEDRDRFIDVFWEQRDPTPGTARNEFKEEHYVRFEYANKNLGREATVPGWKTDRGRMYILLGKPEFIKRFTPSQAHPMELWQYAGYPGFGLPNSFYLLFFQKDGFGQYRLYSPMHDGPQALFVQNEINRGSTPEDLYDYARRAIDADLAHAMFSPLTSSGGHPSSVGDEIEAEMLAAKIQNARNYEAGEKRKYVDDFVQGRPYVKVYYTVGSDGIRDGLYWFQAPNGNIYLDYAVEYEPQKLDMGLYNEYYTSLSVDALIMTADKKELDQIVGTHEVKVSKEQFEKIKSRSFQYQGRRPIVPGKYGMTLVISNNVSQSSATFAHDFEIPEPSKVQNAYLSSVIPIRAIEEASTTDNKVRPFQFGDKFIVPHLPSDFLQLQPLKVFHQVIFPDNFSATQGTLVLHYKILQQGKTESETTQPLDVNPAEVAGNYAEIWKELPISSLSLGEKQLVVELHHEGKLVARAAPMPFKVVNESNTPPVWKFSVSMPGYDSPVHDTILATQLMRLKKNDEAKKLLETAYSKDTSSIPTALQLMRISLQLKEYDRVLDLGLPLEVKNPRNVDLLWLIGWSYYYKDNLGDAARFFERFRMEDSNRVEALNVLADIYYRMNQPEKSLERVQQSLALKPDQKDILDLKQRLESNR